MATTYTVWSIDAWGHAPNECNQYGCPCVSANEAQEEDEHGEIPMHVHDDDRCQCHYEMNDRSRVGVIELDKGESDLAMLQVLQDGGYLKPHATLSDVEFDDPSCDGESIYVQDARTGEPLFQLELQDECSRCGAMPHEGECG